MENTNNIAKEFFIKGSDGKNIFVYCWDNVLNPKAVIQVFHGMAEHAGRYEHFAKHLNSNGFIVYINDHRGHGKTAGTIFTTGFYYYFFKALRELYKKDRLDKIPKTLPVLIISGSEDPVGNYGSWVQKLYNIYKNLGVSNLKLKLYQGARHELINESIQQEVFSDLVTWIDKEISYEKDD
ncbi:MAG: alpha/beta hydrolase [Clostridiaceae bacterium]